MLKIIQLGVTLTDEQGNFPNEVCTWQFNFKFSLEYAHPFRPPAPLTLPFVVVVQAGYIFAGVYRLADQFRHRL